MGVVPKNHPQVWALCPKIILRYGRCAQSGSEPIPRDDFVRHSIIGMFSQGTFRVTWFESSFRASEAGHVPLSENVRIILV